MDWKAIRDRLEEFESSPEQALAYLVELRNRVRGGTTQQKVNSKLDSPMDVVEFYPAIELAITQELLKQMHLIDEKAGVSEITGELVDLGFDISGSDDLV